MSDELPLSPFAYDVPGQLFTVAEGSRRLAEPGSPSDSVAMQLRRWTNQGILYANGIGPRGARLFALHDLVVAKVLGELTHLGIADVSTLRAASLGLYFANPDSRAPHAVWDAIISARDFLSGDKSRWPTFHLEVWLSPDGKRRVVAGVQEILASGGRMVRTPEVEKMLAEGWVVRSMLSIELQPLIMLVFTPREQMN